MKKYNIKITIGWILVAVQCLAIFGNIMSGSGLPSGIPGLIGFLSFGIVGIILLVLGYKNKQD